MPDAARRSWTRDLDLVAAPLIALAIVFCATAAIRGRHTEGAVLFRAIAPLTAGGFFLCLLAMFAEQVRHGLVRVLLVAGGLVLGATAFTLLPRVPLPRIALGYGVPAILAWVAAAVVSKGHERLRT